MQDILQQNAVPTCRRGGVRPKITQEEVEASFEAEGYKLLDLYKNSSTKLNFICNNNHQHQVNWNNWKSGNRCLHCSNRAPVSQNQVAEAFKSEGYELLNEYVNSKAPLQFICPAKHDHSISWSSWVGGSRCGQCLQTRTDRKQGQVEQSFKENGYQLLDRYEDYKSKMRTICPNGHEYSVTWTGWDNGNRCNQCAPNAPIAEEAVIKALSDEGYKLTTPYVNVKTKITVQCPEGHQNQTTFDTWKHKGVRCLYCANRVPITQEFVKESLDREGYTLLNEYQSPQFPLEFVCPDGHSHKMSWNAWQRGVRCGRCYGRHKTDEEKEIVEIKATITKGIGSALRRQKLGRTFSKSNFADRIAYDIYQVLGDRPDDQHLDHIIPKSFYDHRNMEEIEACWDVANLQWLTARENASKGNKLSTVDAQNLTQYQKGLLAIASLKPKRLSKVF